MIGARMASMVIHTLDKLKNKQKQSVPVTKLNKENTKMQSPRRHPRTLEEAFGPYSRGSICEPYTPMTMADKVVICVSIVVMAGLLVALLVGAL